MLQTNRTDETLLVKAIKYVVYANNCSEIFGHDGTNNYMNHALDMKGKSMSNANQLSALTFVNTPTLRAPKMEFSDVSASGATDLIIKSGSNHFIAFTVSNGINIKNSFKKY